MTREPALQRFLDAAKAAFIAQADTPVSSKSLDQIFARLAEAAPQTPQHQGQRLPVCALLDAICDPTQYADQTLRNFMAAFQALEPNLVWRQREGDWTGASSNFGESHANAIMVGPKGLEQREDVWLGVSLVGPNVQYPDHRHGPEETYLIMTEGAFRQGRNDWVQRTTGQTLFNPFNIIHSMRTGAQPLLVFWALREKPVTG